MNMTNIFKTNKNIFETTSRNLENFLYMHKVSFTSQRKLEDGTTCWTYLRTQKFERVFAEYMELRNENMSA